MYEKPMNIARSIFYKILRRELDEKEAIEELEKLKKKSKVIKGYIFGVKSIMKGKKKKFAYDPIEKMEYIDEIFKIVKSMGDNRFLGDFEKGYFLAWKDYIRFLKDKLINDK